MEIIIVQIVRTSSRRQLYSYLNTAPYIRAAFIYGYGSQIKYFVVCVLKWRIQCPNESNSMVYVFSFDILCYLFVLVRQKIISFRVGMSEFYSLLTMSSVTAFLLLGGILT